MAKDKTGGVDKLELGNATKNLGKYIKLLEEAGASQKTINNLTKELHKAHKELNLVKRTEDYTKAQKKLNKEYKEWSRSLEMIKTIGTTVFVVDHIKNIEEMAVKMIQLNSEMHRNLVLAGKNGEAMKGYQKTLNNLSIQLGATHEDANKIVQVLATKQYAGTAKDIDTAAMATYKLAEATKLSKEEIAEITVELQKWGQISAATTEAMYADIMKVAKANGLTKEGVKAVLKQTQEWSGIMKAFGKSPQDVQRYNLSLSKTVSALEKVGISAQTTTSMLDKLTDPTRIEENIAAYAALGMSIEDALSGNLTGEDMASGLKDFGEKLKTMGPIAGAQYAKAFGISYKDAIKATTAELGEMNDLDMTPEEKASKELAAAMESTRDSTEKINASLEKMGGHMRKFGPIALIAISVIASAIFAIIGNSIKKTAEKFVDTFKKGGKEAADDLANSMGDVASKSGEALKAGMYGGAAAAIAEISKMKEESDAKERKRQTAANKQEAKEYEDFFKQAIEAVASKKLTINDSAELVFKDEEIAAQEKLGEIQKAQYEKTKSYYERFTELTKIRKELEGEMDGDARQILETRRDQLLAMQDLDKEAIKGFEKAAADQQKAIDALNVKKEELKSKIEDGVKEVVDSKSFNFLNKIGEGIGLVENKVANMATGFKEKVEGIFTGKKIEIDDGEKPAKRLKKAINDVDKGAGIIDKTLTKGGKKLGKEMEEGTKKSSKGVKAALSGLGSKLGSKIGSAFKKEAKKTKIKPPKIKADKKNFISAGISAGKSIATNIKKGLRNFKIGVKAAAGNSKILGGMMKLGGALGGVAKVAGKLGGAMGIVAIVMRIIGKALEKMEGPMDMINTIMDNLVGILTPILEAILRPLLPLVQVLIKALLPPLLKVLSLLIKVLHLVMKPILAVIKALGRIPGFGFLKEVAEGIDAATGPKVTDALDNAAKTIGDSNTDLAKKTEKNTEATEESTEKKGESLSFNGGKVTVKSSSVSSSSSSEGSSNSTTSNSTNSEGSSAKGNESQMLTIAALSKVKESVDDMKNKFVVFMNRMEDTFNKMASSESSKMYQERAAIEQAFGLDERKVVNVNIADAAGVLSGARNVIKNIFNGGGDDSQEDHSIPATTAEGRHT